MTRPSIPILSLLLSCLALPGCLWLEIETLSDYHPPRLQPDDTLRDDRLEEKKPAFDPTLVDGRPLDGWRVNSSAAVLRLDVPAIKPDVEADFLVLSPSYAAAVTDIPECLLPSVNLLDGKAKQFDDGLYAALDLAYYRGLRDRLTGHVELVRRIYEQVGQGSPAAPYLAAGLAQAGVTVEVTDKAARDEYVRSFQANELASRPIGFYTWSEDLKACFRFLRYFQRPFARHEEDVRAALAAALARDPALRGDYRKAIHFYEKLSNRAGCQSLLDARGAGRPVAFFPPSTSREGVLFEKLFPQGLPPDADLMAELIRRIRFGEVDLKPRPNSGWYEYQVHALETMLLPEKGEEKDKLLLTRAYKKRMLEAFKALITKRRETHLRHIPLTLGGTAMPPPPMPEKIKPRLRVEPCPSYFLRTARAYAFLANFLEAAVGKEGLQTLHGLRQDGPREAVLYTELHNQRDLFYGLYLICAEDIGLKPSFAAGEPVDQERCRKRAAEWLPKAFKDRDLAVDTRVIVPVYADLGRNVTRVWATLGVRLAWLDASYARPPHVKPIEGEGDWQEVERARLDSAKYIIAVDEFAEVELSTLRCPTREEFRALCDRAQTREAIIKALRGWR
jgi:hypothetical protein